MIERPILGIVAVAAVLAASVWGRSARRLLRVSRRIDSSSGTHSEAAQVARAALLKDAHAAVVYAAVALVSAAGAVSMSTWTDLFSVLLLVPVALSLRYAHLLISHARLTESRSQLEQRAQEVLTQEALAPKRWAARLAPEEVPEIEGFELGSVYEAGTGMMAGDFYDVFRASPTRVAAVIGDVAGHGIEPSISAFQAKHLLRVFLRQYRDPAQALEILNDQVAAMDRGEEFISMCVVVFDTQAGTMRYASAGHPASFVWAEGEVQPLRATGPLISLQPGATYTSREISMRSGDLVVMYTDGLAEARNGEQLFGEERIAAHLRRDPDVDPDVLCKSLVEAAADFATSPVTDDIAILAIRRM
ncbi:MAG TPA: PP2C family protein-serine/threonine phosphatase [Acidimicrobiales bacterium]|nr:PP2C family protein-serine/threonine phosphatase [Acidimicrobiales bacterium]